MASRRKLKKQIKKQTNDLIEDAFIGAINGPKSEAKKMDQLIDELIDDRFEILNKVTAYPKEKDGKTIKTHFNQLKQDLADKTAAYKKKIGSIS